MLLFFSETTMQEQCSKNAVTPRAQRAEKATMCART